MHLARHMGHVLRVLVFRHWQWHTQDRNSPYADVMRLTSDVSLLYDVEFLKISKVFAEDQSKLDESFAQAWDQLTNAGSVYSLEKKCYTSKSITVRENLCLQQEDYDFG